MNTTKNDTFNYQAYVKKHSPSAKKIHRGTDARNQRFEAAIIRSRILIDKDILEQFQQLVPQGHGYEKLINQALREWLSAKNVKELVRTELQQVVKNALSTIPAETEQLKSKFNNPSAVKES